MLQVRKYNSIHDIDKPHWDNILDGDDVFHTYDFITAVEDSGVEEASFVYLLFYDRDNLAASTVLSSFCIHLDLFVSNNQLVRFLKKHYPSFFKIKLLTCGLPASFGQLNIKITSRKYDAEVCSLIAQEMKSIGKAKGIKLLAIKEIAETDLPLFKQLEKEGFFCANSIPYMHMDIRWKSFKQYLQSLRTGYRRKIKCALQKIGQSEPIIVLPAEYEPGTAPVFVLSEPGETFADEFYRMYLSVMQRTPTKLEILNAGFFRYLFRSTGNYKMLSLFVNNKIISSAILIQQDQQLTFMLVGRVHEKDKWDSYFNLVYAIVQLAIQSGCTNIKMGQTAYWVKQGVGAYPTNKFIYLASLNPLLHHTLKFLRSVLFPATSLKQVHVFRENKQVVIKKA